MTNLDGEILVKLFFLYFSAYGRVSLNVLIPTNDFITIKAFLFEKTIKQEKKNIFFIFGVFQKKKEKIFS